MTDRIKDLKNVIEMYNEDAECEAELDDGEFTTVKINEVL